VRPHAISLELEHKFHRWLSAGLGEQPLDRELEVVELLEPEPEAIAPIASSGWPGRPSLRTR